MFDLQKASMWKRISAFLFDGILLGVVAVFCALILSALLGFDAHYQTVNDAYARYGEQFGVNFHMTSAEYEALTPEELDLFSAAYDALNADETAIYAYNMLIQLTMLITSLGIFAAFLVMEFFIPLLFGNGQTLGKKIFGIGLMRTDGVTISPVQLFVRTVLGKYALETMIPVLMVIMIYFGFIGLTGTLVLLAIALLQLILLAATRTNALIHDLISATVTVDVASQLIFESAEEMIEYKKRRAAEQI